VTGASFSSTFPVNIPSIVGASTAYVGFTGASGGAGADQQILSWSYSTALTLAAPTFSIAPGTYSSAQTVSISDATSGATIYYTTNGTTPTTSSTVYSTPVSVSSTETLEAIAVDSGYTNSPVATGAYTIDPLLPAPTFSVAAGSYTSVQTVSISDATSGTTIYYTTNGTTPTTSSTKYSGAISVSATETLEAIAVESGYTNSPVATAAYTIDPVLPAPTFSVAAGTYTSAQTVTISDATPGTTIYYTYSGGTPTTSSTKYTYPITVSSTATLRAIAVETGYTSSPVATAAYTIDPVLPAPTFSVAAGTYTSTQTVSIADATSGTTIYYTTNGTTPTTSSTVYSTPVSVSSTETVEAIAVESGYTNSTVATAAYTIDPLLPAPTFSVAAGTYTSTQTVSIADATSGTTIYYTTNGTTPTTSSTKYSGAISVSSTETLEAIAVESGYTNSPVATAGYTISSASAASVPAGNVFTITSFAATPSLMSLNGNAALDGTKLQLTNGSTFETSSAWYATPVNVSTFTTDFTFQLTSAVADGFTFTVQGVGPKALGAGGAGLGYDNVGSSVALKFYLDTITGVGSESTGLFTDGAPPFTAAGSINLVPSGVNLHSGDLMKVHLVYNGTTLTMTLTDTATNASFTQAFTINIPSTVGSSTAYVGFTGASGGAGADQEILEWSYTH